MKKVFIDGQYGTTGLEIHEKIRHEKNIEVINIPKDQKKDIKKRREAYDQADLVVLCLPDEEAKKVVPLIVQTTQAKILDCSTAFRTHSNWVYGFFELKGFKKKIKDARLVSNPGCYAIAFIALMKPLISGSLISSNFIPTIFGVSGYTGGGKGLIEKYQPASESGFDNQPFLWYSLDLEHKHLKEMQLISGLTHLPMFIPSVVSIPRGLAILTTLNHQVLKENNLDAELVFSTLTEYYKNEPTIEIKWLKKNNLLEEKFFNLEKNKFKSNLSIFLTKNRIGDLALFSLIDNLGKGASLNALANLRLMLESP